MISFAKRNLKLFFRDRTSVFFSLLAVFIIIGLYVLFLGDVWTSNLADVPGVRFLMDSWIMSGLLAITSMTTTMGAFGIMVEDKTRKINKDFISSPLKKSSITGGYIISAFVIGVIMTILALVLAEIYIVAYGGELLRPVQMLKVLGLIILSTFMNTSLVFFLVSFFNSASAFSTASTILGTLIGFLTGIYLPVGQLTESVQYVIKVFPVSHSALLLRQVMMADPITRSFAGAPADVIQDFELLMGVKFQFGNTILSPVVSLLVIAGAGILFYLLSLLRVSRKQN